MKRAHMRDAVRTQLFHFRKHIAPPMCSDDSNSNEKQNGVSDTRVEVGNDTFNAMSNTERSIAAAIAAEVNSTPCGPCKSQVSHSLRGALFCCDFLFIHARINAVLAMTPYLAHPFFAFRLIDCPGAKS